MDYINNKNTIAIVVTYNIKQNEIEKNIKTYQNFVDKVIVIDNSDSDEFKLKFDNSKIVYIKLKENYGIAKALNNGMEYAIDNKYEYALTMDQDSYFNNNLIGEYNKCYNEGVIIYSPNYIIARKKNKKHTKNSEYLYWTMTSGNVVCLKYFNDVGKFREDFFIDGVDYEYCLRARKKGYKILQCNNAKLIHNPGITKIKNILGYKYKYGYMSPTRLYYQVRNLKEIAKEYNSNRARFIILIKYLKIILLFDNKKEFLNKFHEGIKDCKNGKFGKYEKDRNKA